MRGIFNRSLIRSVIFSIKSLIGWNKIKIHFVCLSTVVVILVHLAVTCSCFFSPIRCVCTFSQRDSLLFDQLNHATMMMRNLYGTRWHKKSIKIIPTNNKKLFYWFYWHEQLIFKLVWEGDGRKLDGKYLPKMPTTQSHLWRVSTCPFMVIVFFTRSLDSHANLKLIKFRAEWKCSWQIHHARIHVIIDNFVLIV
jgi:hypothetical protein